MSKFYVTTPIYYVNGAPHIGHAYTTIIADALARYHRQHNDDVFFLTGTDEHGLKIQREADKQNISPQEMVDKNSAQFRQLFQNLKLTHNRFIRTTEDEHKVTVTQIVERMLSNGDIYLDKYEGWYAAADEAYYDASEIADGKAIASGSPVEWVEEESYFFRLSNYQERLLQWYSQNPTCIAPIARKNEVVAFVEGGLHDLSISRTTFSWGIPMPSNPKHVLYVWVDALTNYISAVGAFRDSALFDTYWPADMHLIGKDILRFHAVYWPAFLMSANLALPKQIFAHGWWMNEGEKMSKSKGNFIDAFELAQDYDLDVLRYYLLREVPLGSDGNFVKERLIERNNSELADNLGNLVNRTFKMAQRFLNSNVPTIDDFSNDVDQALINAAQSTLQEYHRGIHAMELHRALEIVLLFSSDLNNYIQSTQPWELHKDGDDQRLKAVLYNALEGIRWASIMIAPFLPDAAHKIQVALGLSDTQIMFHSLKEWGQLSTQSLDDPGVLFSKYDSPASNDKKNTQIPKDKTKKQPSNKKKKTTMPEKIDFSDFLKVDIRVGEIRQAERVEGADKLLKLSVNVGEESDRSVVAGLAKSFSPEELINKRVAVVANLKPAKLFGILSEAMILATETDNGKLTLAYFGPDVKPGTPIS